MMLDQTAKNESGSASDDGRTTPPPEPDRRRGLGLTWRLLTLTVLFMMATAILIYVPTIANFRVSWLADRMTMADAASSVLALSVAADIPREIQDELLTARVRRTASSECGNYCTSTQNQSRHF